MPRIRGFRLDGRPYVSAEVHLARLQARVDVDFLLDTGADFTSIHLDDRLFFDARSVRTGAGLTPAAAVSGIGGVPLSYAVEAAEYVLEGESGLLPPLRGRAHIALEPAARGVPSLLGRDILDLMLFCISDREIALDW